MRRNFLLLLLTISSSMLSNCEPQVQAINYGQDGCNYCRMTIVEEMYGTELLTKKGKAYKFDSIECLAAFVLKGEIATENIENLYFTDFEDAGNLHPLSDIIFVQAKKLKSPMGLNLSAFRNLDTAQNVAELYFGNTMSWDQVRDYVDKTWLK